jgi:hypothetical protein
MVALKIDVPQELNSMLDQIVLSTGVSKSSLVRDAITRYGEALGFLPPGASELVTATRTRGPGPASSNRKEMQ